MLYGLCTRADHLETDSESRQIRSPGKSVFEVVDHEQLPDCFIIGNHAEQPFAEVFTGRVLYRDNSLYSSL